jgi:4-methyl-5(b-hydroxyethyl)-thiazole monophosphate biosynthesis
MARVLVPLAEGFEEIEAVTVIDLLRRAGIEVCIAKVAGSEDAGPGVGADGDPASEGPDLVTGSHGIAVQADARLAELDDAGFDMIVLPGGMPGAAHLKADSRVIAMLRGARERGAYVAAICAAPSVLAHAGLLDGRAATSFPGFLDAQSAPGVQLSTAPVVIDGRIVTSRGPGTAIDFALTLIELLAGGRVRGETESRLQRPQPAAQPS